MIDSEPIYCISEEYGALGAEVLQLKRQDLLDLGVAVGFISSSKKKTRGKTQLVYGECKKVPEIWKLYCPYDFVIIIYDLNCEHLDDKKMKILMWHELLHIGIDDKGEPYVKPHDVEEFDDIIKEYGLRWDS